VLLSAAGPLEGIGLALRVVALAFPGVLFASVVDPVRLADALTIHWRLPTRFAYGALAALRLVPLLIVELQTIRLARRARGVDAGRNPVVHARLLGRDTFTLLVGAVRRGTRLATAMDARGFDSGVTRTNARGSVLRRSDFVFVATTVLLCAAAVGTSVYLGAWSPIFVG
nr:energy-coupling factor transporter transmembrane protein EcfT [Geodermatophilaceae bacterium]